MSNISIGNMTLGIYQTNCYFVYREDSDKVLVFDPADHGKKIEAGTWASRTAYSGNFSDPRTF